VKSFHKFFKERDKIYRHDVPVFYLILPRMYPFNITAGGRKKERETIKF
jgi:hypothetical protein